MGGGRGRLAAGIAFVVFAAAAYALLRPGQAPSVSQPAVAVPAAAARAPRPQSPGESVERPTPAPVFAETDSSPTPAPDVSAPPSAAPRPPPPPSDSVDAQRERGAAAYQAAMKNVSGRLSALRAHLKSYNEQCSGGLLMGPSGAMRVQGCDQPRDEIGEALREIQAALEEAEEAARRSWVDPRACSARSGIAAAWTTSRWERRSRRRRPRRSASCELSLGCSPGDSRGMFVVTKPQTPYGRTPDEHPQ